MKILIYLVFTCGTMFNCIKADRNQKQLTETNIVTIDSLRLSAKVIRIVDGDTMEVLYGELPVMIRLAHIDCPEKRSKQPFGKAAKKALSDLCFGQEVTVATGNKKDRSGRLIAEIINENGLNVNQEMVRLGMAWHFKKYSDSQIYADLENQARKDKIGLWQNPTPIPPWKWRKHKK